MRKISAFMTNNLVVDPIVLYGSSHKATIEPRGTGNGGS